MIEIKQHGPPVIAIAKDTLAKNKQALVFASTKSSAEKTAEDISKTITGNNRALDEIAESIRNVLQRPTKQCLRLARCAAKGIAFHHAGLAARQREIIEDSFREGNIKIICSTPTLAFGLNLPAYRVIIKDMRRFGQRGYAFIPVLDYLQMSGRAGRPKYDKTGQSIMIAASEADKDELHERYIMGRPEEIYSKLAVEPILRTYVLSLISTGLVRNRKELIDFFGKTFWAYQYRDNSEIEFIISKVIEKLDEWGFIVSSASGDFVSADEIKEEGVRATLVGKRVSELYLDPYTAHYFIECLKKATRPNAFSFMQMISNTLEMRPLLNVRSKEYEKVEEALAENERFLMDKEPPYYEDGYEKYLKSIKTAMMMNDWVEEKDEDFILEEYNVRPGELRAKLDIADWLLYANEEITKLMSFRELRKDVIKIRKRLKYGVKEELLPLLKLEQVGRVRARLLFRNRIKTLEDVRKADISSLTQILNSGRLALNIKKQVGADVSKLEVPQGKRKGQISLKDYGT